MNRAVVSFEIRLDACEICILTEQNESGDSKVIRLCPENVSKYATMISEKRKKEFLLLFEPESLREMFAVRGGSVEYEFEGRHEESWFVCSFFQYSRENTVLVNIYDVSAEKRREEEFRYRYEHDVLTNVLNRVTFENKVRRIIAKREKWTKNAFCILDIDRFKLLNDMRGHAFGDDVLVKFCQLLKENLPRALIGRYGGDEFVVFFQNVRDERELSAVFSAFYRKLRHFSIGDENVTTSAGIVITDDLDYDTMFSKADTALYHAKEDGRDCYRFYDDTMRLGGKWEAKGASLGDQISQERKGFKLRTIRLAAIALPVIAVLCICYFGLMFNTIKSDTTQTARENAMHMAAAAKLQIESGMRTVESLVDYIRTEGDGASIDKYMQMLVNMQRANGFRMTALVSDNGRLIFQNGTRGNMGEDWQERDSLTSSPIIMVRTQVANQDDCLFMFAPVSCKTDLGIEFSGVGAFYDLDSIKSSLMSKMFEDRSDSFIIRKNGEIVIQAHGAAKTSDLENYYLFLEKNGRGARDAQQLEDIRTGVRGGEQLLIRREEKDGYKLIVFTPIDIQDWYVVTEIPGAVLDDRVNMFLKPTLVLCAIMLLLFVIAIVLISFFNRMRLDEISYVDSVTGGANYTLFLRRARSLLERTRKLKHVIVYVNVKNFKMYNDQNGHINGDNVIRYIDEAISKVLKPKEAHARISADRFALLLADAPDDALSERIKEMLKPVASLGVQLEAGVYHVGKEELELQQMVDRAMLALRENDGTQTEDITVLFYDGAYRKRQLKESKIEGFMRRALKNGEFHVYIQPSYDTRTKRMCRCEALTRWNNPELGILMPADFHALFERNGFIVELDLYVFEQVCRMIRRRLDDGRQVIPVSVNVSRAHFKNPDFIMTDYKPILEKYGVSGEHVEIEITETVVYENMSILGKITEQIQSLGMKCWIDDFGSGYSSLNLLQMFSADGFKLDRAFFTDMASSDEKQRRIVQAVIHMAHSIGMDTVAEGVEDMTQVEFLESVGCGSIQGFVFSKPVPMPEFERLLDEKKE